MKSIADQRALLASKWRSLVRTIGVRLVISFWAAAVQAYGGLNQYGHLVVADRTISSAPAKEGVRVTYLGTNAYLLESREAALLVDPYFSRVSLCRVASNLPMAPDRDLIKRHLPAPSICAVLVTHGHFDHLLDVGEVVKLTGAKLVASSTSVQLAVSTGVLRQNCVTVTAGRTVRLRGATVRVLAAKHDRLLGCIPFNGPPRRLPPRSAGDWVCGEPLAFLIEMGGRRIYIESGGQPGSGSRQSLGRIDLAILGVALPDSRKRFPQTLEWLHPRYVIPSHQDDFFLPLSRGFVFGRMTDFPFVLRAFRASSTSSSLILLDYFRPWTLP